MPIFSHLFFNCACACVYFSNCCGLHLCLCSLLELQGRAGHRDSVGVQMPVCGLVGTAPEQWISTRREGGTHHLADAGMEEGGECDVLSCSVRI